MSRKSRAKRKQLRQKKQQQIAREVHRSTSEPAGEILAAPLGPEVDRALMMAIQTVEWSRPSEQEVFSALELDFFRRGDEVHAPVMASWREEFESDFSADMTTQTRIMLGTA